VRTSSAPLGTAATGHPVAALAAMTPRVGSALTGGIMRNPRFTETMTLVAPTLDAPGFGENDCGEARGVAIAMSLSSTSKPKREKREVSTARPRRRNAPWMSPTRELFAAAESLAIQIYPWDRLKFEIEATEGVLGLSSDMEAKLPRAIWWAVMQLDGDDEGEAFNTLFPCLSRPVQKLEWGAMFGVAPITTDETTVGKIVSFVMAARNLLIEAPLAERTQLLKLLIETASEMRRTGSTGSAGYARGKTLCA
jgi:hypothetical protein